MKFRDLKKQYLKLKEDIDTGIENVIDSTTFISGKQVKELEEQLASFVGVKHCVTCGNGTDALIIPLMCWGIREGDAVFVPDFTFVATAEAVALLGATPVFVDIDPRTLNMDPARLEEAIQAVIKEGTLTPRAVITVDLFGLPADYPEIRKITDRYHLYLLEDGAQSFGAHLNGQKCGSFGDISATSFFPTKPLGCYGDGGAMFTDDDETAEILRSIAVHGKGAFKYDNVRLGCNSRLDTLQAAILIPKLQALQQYELDRVNEAAKMYTAGLQDVVTCPVIPDGACSAWAQYTIRLKDQETRDALKEHLTKQDIPTFIHYPKPLHMQKAYEGYPDYQDCPVSETASQTVLSLPMHPYLEEEEIRMVTEEIIRFLKQQ